MENERDHDFVDESDVDATANAADQPDQQAEQHFDQQPGAEKRFPPERVEPGSREQGYERRPGESPRIPPPGEESRAAEAIFARKFREWRQRVDNDILRINRAELIATREGETVDDIRIQLKHQRYLEELREVTMRAKYLEAMTDEDGMPLSVGELSSTEEREELQKILHRVSFTEDMRNLRQQVAELQTTTGVYPRSHPRPPSVEEYHRLTGKPQRPEGYRDPVPPPPEPDGIMDLTKQIHSLLEELEMRLGPLCVGSPGSSVVSGPEGPPSSEYMAMLLNARMRLRDLMDRMVVI